MGQLNGNHEKENTNMNRRITCINLTQRGRQCKNVPLNINVYHDGVMSQHCARHWSEFFGRFGALPSGIVSVVRYTAGRYNQLLNSRDRVDDAWRYAMLDSWGADPERTTRLITALMHRSPKFFGLE